MDIGLISTGGPPEIVERYVQTAEAAGFAPPFVVCRLLTPLGLAYKQSVERFAPFDSLGLARFSQRVRRLGSLRRRAACRGSFPRDPAPHPRNV